METLKATLLDNKRLAASHEVYDDSTLEAMVGRKPELSLAKKVGFVALGAFAAVAVLRARRK